MKAKEMTMNRTAQHFILAIISASALTFVISLPLTFYLDVKLNEAYFALFGIVLFFCVCLFGLKLIFQHNKFLKAGKQHANCL